MPFQPLKCEDGAWISICPSKEALQESCTIAAPDLAVVVDQLSLQTSRISPLILALMVQHLLGSTAVIILPSVLTNDGTCLPNSMYRDGKLSRGFPLQPPAYRASREAPWWDCPDTTKLTACQSDGWVAWTATWCHLSRVSPVLKIPETPPPDLYPEPYFGGIGTRNTYYRGLEVVGWCILRTYKSWERKVKEVAMYRRDLVATSTQLCITDSQILTHINCWKSRRGQSSFDPNVLVYWFQLVQACDLGVVSILQIYVDIR